MILPGTNLVIADNTGAKRVRCIRILGGASPSAGQIGDTIVVSVKEAAPTGTVKKKEVVRAVIVRQKQPILRRDGVSLKFDDNAVALINQDGTPKGTRVFGPIAREVKDKGFTKIATAALEIV